MFPSIPRVLSTTLLALSLMGRGLGLHACSTIQVKKGDALLVGHNLDESIPVPGLILVNKRGVAKESISYQDISSFRKRVSGLPRIQWVSRYGSIVYTTCGREFPDGGLNEAGLYVGEMTLLGSEYPEDPGLVKIYHHAWMQYLLDNFASVGEVLGSLSKVVPDGHCQWHFFVADRQGNAAVIEFDGKKTQVYTSDSLPVKVSTNFTYPSCLKKLSQFKGFGGDTNVEPSLDCKPDRRFILAADMIKRVEATPGPATPDHAFEILRAMYCGSWNRWSLVFDLKAMRVTWNTNESRLTRYVDLSAFDFDCRKPVMVLDINRPLSGDVAGYFVPLTDEINLDYVKRFWKGVDAGFFGNLFLWKTKFPPKMQAYQQSCAPVR